ncbi:MAG: FHA domain-containing protein [Sporichthyaceae bacterium]
MNPPAAGGLDSLRAVVGAGSGIVARVPGVLILASEMSEDLLASLLPLLTSAGARADTADALARSLAGWPGSADPRLSVGVLIGASDGYALLVHGQLVVMGTSTRVVRSGSDQLWLTERLPAATGPLSLVLSGGANVAGAPWGLGAGVVPGGSVTLIPAGAVPAGAMSGHPGGSHRDLGAVPAPLPAAIPAPAPVPAPIPAPAPVPAPIPVPAAPPQPRPARVDSLLIRPDAPARAPLPVGPVAPQRAAAGGGSAQPGDVQVAGHRCSRGHLNDPRVRFCGLCGIRMDEQTRALINGRRPPLGLMVMDDGSTYRLDGDYLLGRAPEADPRVAGGQARPLKLTDIGGRISRVHIHVALSDWDVFVADEGSANGTFLATAGQSDWKRLPARARVQIDPGTRVLLGERSFVYESVFAS